MHMWMFFVVIVGMTVIMASFELARRAVVGRRMERSLDEMASSGVRQGARVMTARAPANRVRSGASGRVPAREFVPHVRRAS